MKKSAVRNVILLMVLLALYILITFLIPFAHTATFWVSFAFTLVAFDIVAAAVYMAFIKNPEAISRFYGFPIAKIGVFYGLFQLIAGFLLMALATYIPAWIAVLICAVALGAVIIGLVSAEAIVEEIRGQDVRLKKDVALMRSLQSKVVQMAAQSEDAGVKALADEFRYSDPVSSDALAEIERDLVAAVDELQAAVVDGDSEAAKLLCRKASVILTERNRLCKLNKN